MRYSLFALVAATTALIATPAQAQRALGLDVSAWQGSLSQTTWNNIHNNDNLDFAFIRSSRGGTTGYYNQSNAGNNNPPGQNTESQRYDDPYFIQNITYATKAGMFAGSYHFGRMDIIDGTLNALQPNNGMNEATHFLQMAGAWMRPGYMLPVFDLEAGISQRTGQELAQFAIDFSDKIYAEKGFRPAVYTGGNYAQDMQNEADAATRLALVQAYPTLWDARWPNQTNPETIPIQTGHPKDSYTPIYGPWDDYGVTHPWHFWQYTSNGMISSFGNRLDLDVAQGGTEFLKDHLVPALWTTDSSGSWGTLANWNSGVTETEPVTGPGQVARVGPAWHTATVGDLEARPEPRLPGTDTAAVQGVYGSNDTVILDRGAANPTITLSSGAYTIRKLYAREALNITGGSLTMAYAPSSDSTPISAQFSAPVSVSGGGSLSVHTLNVDSSQTLTVGNASLQFNAINLASAGTPAKLLVNGDVNVSPLGAATATVANSGSVDLAGGNRNFNVANGAAAVDVAINAPITNGALTKSGAGTLALGGVNTYTGNTTVLAGTLSLGSATALHDSSSLFLSSDSTLNLTFGSGTPDLIDALYFNGVAQAEGIWGAAGSGAQWTSPFITGTGRLSIAVPPPPPPGPGPGNVLDNFDVNEGHFAWSYSYSPSSQTNGLAPPTAPVHTTIDRVTHEAQRGVGSQELNIVIDDDPDTIGWHLRHNSGFGTPGTPAGNVTLPATGWVGFWVKTDDAGVTVELVLDDPNTGERGVAQDVVDDNEWHLYQWNLEDDSHWNSWVNGNGSIDQATVTIDSIFFNGSGNAQIYLDTVSHNPEAMLAAPAPGDFDGDGDVDADDLADWEAGFGSANPEVENGDADEDGDVDGDDFLTWQRNLTGPMSTTAAKPVPEPGAGVLLALAAIGLLAARRGR